MKTLLRERITGTTNTSNAVDVSIPQIKPGQSAYITHLALENDSGESVTVFFGVLSMGTLIKLWAKQTVADSDAVGIQVTLPLLEGDKLTAQVTGSAKSGKVVFAAGGELLDDRPEIVEVVQETTQGTTNA